MEPVLVTSGGKDRPDGGQPVEQCSGLLLSPAEDPGGPHGGEVGDPGRGQQVKRPGQRGVQRIVPSAERREHRCRGIIGYRQLAQQAAGGKLGRVLRQ
jgi:hypothetical protein